MTNKIQLLNPDPSKKGAAIDRDKYILVKETMLIIIEKNPLITFKELMNEVSYQLIEKLDGSASWYCTAVKLDLEARGLIERVGSSSPQRLRLTNK